MTSRPEFNRHVAALRFQRIANAQKDALWSMALVFSGNRQLAQALLTHSLGKAWKSISAAQERAGHAAEKATADDREIRREIFFALAQTGLGILVGQRKPHSVENNAGDNSLLRVNLLRSTLDPESLCLLALTQYSDLSIGELSTLFALPEDVLRTRVERARADTVALLSGEHSDE